MRIDENTNISDIPVDDALLMAAQDAFFAVIAKGFPHIKSGDFPPDATERFERECRRAVQVWVWGNTPTPAQGAPLAVLDEATIERLSALAVVARPRDNDDHGSERQIGAENAFFDAFNAAMGDTGDFEDYCLKATTEEMLDEAMRLVRERAKSSN